MGSARRTGEDAAVVDDFDGAALDTGVWVPPDHPMQMMAAVFDFPEKASAATDGHMPPLAVDSVRGGPVPA